MSVTKSYFRSIIFILAAMILGKAASFFWKMILLRYDVALLGEIEVFLTTLGLAVTFSTLAFPAAVTRFALQKKRKAFSYFLHGLVRSFQAFTAISLLIWLLSQANILTPLYFHLSFPVFLGLVAISVTQEGALAFLNSQKKFALYGIGKYLLTPGLKLSLLLLIFLAIAPKSFLFSHVVWGTALAALVVSLIPFLEKKTRQALSLSPVEKRRFLSYSLFLSGSFLAFMMYGALDVYLLAYFFNYTAVGIYVGLLTLINLMDLLFLPFLHTLPAKLSEKRGVVARITLTENLSGWLFKVGIILGVGLATTGFFIFPILSNNILRVSFVTILIFVVFKTLHYSLVHVYRHFLDFQGYQQYTAQTMIASLVLKLLLGWWLVQRWNIAGLAIANIGADLFHVWLLTKRIRSLKS